MKIRLLTLATVGLVLAGCTATAAPIPAGASLVFQIAFEGLVVPASDPFTLPYMSLYGDGLLIAPGSTPLAPVTRQLTPAGVHRVVRGAVDAGLAGPTDYGTPRNVDTGPTRFTVLTSQPHTTRVLFVQDVGVDDEVNPAQRAERQRLRAFVSHLDDLDGWLGADITPGTRPYRYPSIVVFAEPHSTDPATSVPAWPLADLGTAGTPYSHDLYSGRCQVVAAADLAAAPSGSVWHSGSHSYYVILRPLLPDEKSCADLT